MPYVKFMTDNVNLDITFKDRVIFIKGNSGSGKTSLIKRLGDSKNKKFIESDLKVVVLNSYSEEQYNDCDDLITIMDEQYAKKYFTLIKEGKGYYIVISRKPRNDINYSYRSVYIADRDNSDFITVFKEQFKLTNDPDYIPDCIITEDSAYGYDYVRKFI